MRHARLAVLPMLAFAVSMLEPSAVVVTAAGRSGAATERSRAPALGAAATLAEQDPPAVEAELGLARPARRLIQQGLQNEGFDPGAPDGRFGPRTRAAIRDWQAARGDSATGYLDGVQAALLREASLSTDAAARDAASTSSPVAAGATAQPVSASAEAVFWQSVMNSTNPEELEAYLLQFPNGVFRALAEVRLASLRGTQRVQSTVVVQPAGGEKSLRAAGAEGNATRSSPGGTPAADSAGAADPLPTETNQPERRGSIVASPPVVNAPAVAEASPAPAVNCDDWNTEAFFEAANASAVAACLAAGADVAARNDDLVTPLHWTAWSSKNSAVAEVLLAGGADVEARNDNAHTPLHNAARNNPNPAMIEALLVAGADVGAQDDNGLTPLLMAATFTENPAVVEALVAAGTAVELGPLVGQAAWNNENVEVLEALLAAGVNQAWRAGDGRTLLHLAAQNNPNPAVAQALLAAGADIEARSDNASSASTPLHNAASNNANPAVVQALLAAGADIEARSDTGSTPLHRAAAFTENPAVVEALLAAGADIEARSDNGSTPLHRAAAFTENPAVVEALVAAGASLEAPLGDGDPTTPLSLAVWNNENVEVLEVLLAAGANPSWRAGDGRTLLHLAAENNDNPAVVEALLRAGANLEARDEHDRTPMRLAVRHNENTAVAMVLLEAAGDLTASGDLDSLLLDTWQNPNAEDSTLVEALLAAGADPMARAGGDHTPLQLAVWADNVAAVEALLEAGADSMARDLFDKTPLHDATSPTVVEILLEAEADPMARDSIGQTPLHGQLRVEVVEALLQAGADVLARDDRGDTPLHEAAHYNVLRTLDALLQAGADVLARDDRGNTPLHEAVNPGLFDSTTSTRVAATVDTLVVAGVNVNARNQDGNTALHEAASFRSRGGGHLGEAIAALLAAGADVSARNQDGQTPFDLAAENDALRGSDAYWLLNDARFSATPRPESRRPTPTGGPPGFAARAAQPRQTRACEIPDYPMPADPPSLGLDWCESTIGFQRRVFALQAAGAWCAIAGSTSTSPEQVSARHQEINAACDALDALAQGAPSCRCPAGYRP